MAFGTHQHLSGLLRGFLMRPHELTLTVDEIWRQTPTPREIYVNRIAENCRFKSKGKMVLRDLIRLMAKEHNAYLDAISIFLATLFKEQYPEIDSATWAQHAGYGMALEYRTLEAWHLAANRAIARLLLAPVPEKIENHDLEPWMQCNRNRQARNVVSFNRHKDQKYFSRLRKNS